MKKSLSLVELKEKLEGMRDKQEDYVSDTRNLMFKTDEAGSVLTMRSVEGMKEFPVMESAHEGIAMRLGIPQAYYQNMRKKFPELLDMNVNGWLNKLGRTQMVRVLDGHVRAFLSDRYRCLDNLELLNMVIPHVEQNYSDFELVSSGLTDRHMFLKFVSERIKEEVVVGDIVQNGFVISNSEVGWGAVRVLPLIFRLVCTNGMIAAKSIDGIRRNHVGGRIECGEFETRLVDPVIMAEKTDMFLASVQDGISSLKNSDVFMRYVNMLRSTLKRSYANYDAEELVNYTGKLLGISRKEREVVLGHYNLEGVRSQYGLLNAITRASQDVKDYERATELERIGSMVLLPANASLIDRHMERFMNAA